MSQPLREQRGFALTELLIMGAMVIVLSAVALVFYHDFSTGARVVKARSDIRTLTMAVYDYADHTGGLPSSLQALAATATNADGLTAGPFAALPAPPAGWSPYIYVPTEAGFSIVASGDGVTVAGPCDPCPYASLSR
jgi:type II secretory pathway pseudopilin PulG